MINKSNIRFAKDGTAWKASSMRGYIKKTVLDAETYGNDAYKLTFVKADGTEYDFFYDNGTGVGADNLVLDKDLLDNILEPNWISSTAAECEADRTSASNW